MTNIETDWHSRIGAIPVDLGEIEFHYYQTAMKDVIIENTGSYLEVTWNHVLWHVRRSMHQCSVTHIDQLVTWPIMITCYCTWL